MAAAFMPTTAEDATRQQLVSAFFWTVGDILAGTDSTMRVDPGSLRTDGLLGPGGSSTSYGVGNGGEVYVRGVAGQAAGTGQTQVDTKAGISISPGLLVMALVAFLVLKH